jgi:transcriptional regulator with PAS, ATPase and Fis domain
MELANGGTIFLDEIGDMNPFLQSKLLRVIQEMEFERVGGTQTIKVDVRIISATNRNLLEMAKSGNFREDLYYRLNVLELHLPSSFHGTGPDAQGFGLC